LSTKARTVKDALLSEENGRSEPEIVRLLQSAEALLCRRETAQVAISYLSLFEALFVTSRLLTE
jgi:hypothetical protein